MGDQKVTRPGDIDPPSFAIALYQGQGRCFQITRIDKHLGIAGFNAIAVLVLAVGKAVNEVNAGYDLHGNPFHG